MLSFSSKATQILEGLNIETDPALKLDLLGLKIENKIWDQSVM